MIIEQIARAIEHQNMSLHSLERKMKISRPTIRRWRDGMTFKLTYQNLDALHSLGYDVTLVDAHTREEVFTDDRRSYGMKCDCGGFAHVIETRPISDREIMRQRKCTSCHKITYSYETTIEMEGLYKDEWKKNWRSKKSKT